MCYYHKYVVLAYLYFRGTVVTGRVTRGKLKTGQEVEILGYGKTFKAKVNGECSEKNRVMIENYKKKTFP